MHYCTYIAFFERSSNHRLNERWLSPEGFPITKFSILISSSRPGQCIPSPFPIKRQLLRSSGLPCKSRGYHASGAEMVRPSVRSTVIESSVTTIFCALTTCILASPIRSICRHCSKFLLCVLCVSAVSWTDTFIFCIYTISKRLFKQDKFVLLGFVLLNSIVIL